MPSDPRMATESRRRTNAAYAERRLAAGWAKVMVWLSPEAVAALPALVKEHGSRDAAINARLVGEPPAPAENPAPPASVTRGGKRRAPSGASEPKNPPEDEPLRFPKAPYGSRLKPVKRKP